MNGCPEKKTIPLIRSLYIRCIYTYIKYNTYIRSHMARQKSLNQVHEHKEARTLTLAIFPCGRLLVVVLLRYIIGNFYLYK